MGYELRIANIKIENFRSIQSADLDFTQYNCFVGPNSSGKSTILDAMEVFFGKRRNYSESDFFQKDISQKVKIFVEFTDLGEEICEVFKGDIRSNKLRVGFDLGQNNGKFEARWYAIRFVYPGFAAIFQKSQSGKPLDASEVSEIYETFRQMFPDLTKETSKGGQLAAVRSYEESKITDNEKEWLPSEDNLSGFAGISKLQNYIEWVYVPAVKEASTEAEENKNSHLGQLIARTVKQHMNYDHHLEKLRQTTAQEYKSILDGQKTHLLKLQGNISMRLKESFLSEVEVTLDWVDVNTKVNVNDPSTVANLSSNNFSGSVESFGHGLQRAFLLALLQEVDRPLDTSTKSLILAIEEPELYQHPPQARHLANVLAQISKTADAQIFITTHSPYFVNIEAFDGLKKFKNHGNGVEVSHATFGDVLIKYDSYFEKKLDTVEKLRAKLAVELVLQLPELFFAEKVVLVEGMSDVAYFESYIKLWGYDEKIRKRGVSFLPCGGKSTLAFLLMIAKTYKIPYYIIFDMDMNLKGRLSEHLRDNNAIFRMVELPEIFEGFSDDIIAVNQTTAWNYDIENYVEKALGNQFKEIRNLAEHSVGQLANSKKNILYVAATMREARERKIEFPEFEETLNSILS